MSNIRITDRKFFTKNADKVARNLLGKIIFCKKDGEFYDRSSKCVSAVYGMGGLLH